MGEEEEAQEQARQVEPGGRRWDRIVNESITVRLPRTTMDRIRDLADQEEVSISHIFRQMASFYLDYVENPDRYRAEERKRLIGEILESPEFLGALDKRITGKIREKAKPEP